MDTRQQKLDAVQYVTHKQMLAIFEIETHRLFLYSLDMREKLCTTPDINYIVVRF